MCGIIAHLNFHDDERIQKLHLKTLNDMLSHRGPDDEGMWLEGDIALSMRRLSIIDLAGGGQPITSVDRRFTIVFNGEIYNHDDLRRQLIALGHPIKTRSDTETLLYAYAAWGEACLSKLNGMFAFAIWDRDRESLFIARDRMGVKPLYYAMDAKRFMLASELTPIVASGFFQEKVDLKAVSDYLSYWYICEPRTVFQGIHQLPPAHCATVKDGRMDVKRWWHIPVDAERRISFGDAVDELEGLMEDAVSIRSKVDVPIGTFLSGGIDSGLVTAMAKGSLGHFKSFAIGFKDPSYDETPLARLSAARLGVDLDVHIMEEVTPALIEEIIGAFDEPLGNASYVPTYLLARAARTRMKVVLTGDGGDELFGGYPTYQAPYYQAMWQGTPAFIRSMVKGAVASMPVSHKRISLDYRLKQLVKGIELDYRRAHHSWREIASLSLQKDLWKADAWGQLDGYDPFSVSGRYFDEGKGLSKVNQLMYADINTYLLNDHLRKVDRMTMAHGLEARVPFMDYRIVEFAMRLPAEHKVDLGATKKILKAIARKHLPQGVVKGKKKGLTSPIAGWISGALKDYMAQELRGGLVGGLFNRNAIEGLCQDHWDKRQDNSRILWGLLTLQVWNKKMKGIQ